MKSLIFSVVGCAVVSLHWNISYVENVNPDGLFPRRAIGVNGKWPIPRVEASLGDLLVIHVENQLLVPTALHTHGLYHNNTNYMDGAGLITECGIAPGTSLTYSIPIQQTGSYWIHGHMSGQYVDGFQTSLILKQEGEEQLLGYDQEYVLSFSDWYHEEHSVLLKQFLGIFNPLGAEPVPDSVLINHGLPTELVFEPQKTYRLRLISMAAVAMFHFYIDDHTLQIVEVDGELVNPFEVNVISLAAAQRYSVLVKAKASSTVNYKAYVKMDPGMLVHPCTNPNATVSVIYQQDAPFFKDNMDLDFPADPAEFDELQLVPLKHEGLVNPDVSIIFDVTFEVFEDASNHGSFNQTVFDYPLVPSIFTALTMNENAMNPATYGPRTLATVLKHLDMVELVINNFDGGPHPFHLHGHKFQVLKIGKGRYDSTQALTEMKPNPLRRDTVTVPGSGFVVLRFRADNPGVWLMHCHVEWHCIFY
jgi:iron transport multicopper oxidase